MSNETKPTKPHPLRCEHELVCTFRPFDDIVKMLDCDGNGCEGKYDTRRTSHSNASGQPKDIELQHAFREGWESFKESDTMKEHDDLLCKQERDRVTEWLFEEFKNFTKAEYRFGDDPGCDWWIEKVGTIRTSDYPNYDEPHDAMIRKQERERVLDEVTKQLKKEMNCESWQKENQLLSWDGVESIIISLRSTTAPQEERG